MNNLKLRGGIMLGAVALSTLLVLIKAVKLVIPVIGGALTAFAILTVKAYVSKRRRQ